MGKRYINPRFTPDETHAGCVAKNREGIDFSSCGRRNPTHRWQFGEDAKNKKNFDRKAEGNAPKSNGDIIRWGNSWEDLNGGIKGLLSRNRRDYNNSNNVAAALAWDDQASNATTSSKTRR
mgnify:CR=1 FL=1